MTKVVLVFVGFVAWLASPPTTLAGALFQDGFLGLTQTELTAKLGPPHKVRTKMAAQRVYNYHTFDQWESSLKDMMSVAAGEYVYVFTREKVNVRYAFQFIEESAPNAETPTLTINLVDIEFLHADPQSGPLETPVTVPLEVPLRDIPKLVPEFQPSLADDAPAYRSNLFIILVQAPPSPEARRLVRERAKADYDWSLSYRLYTTQNFPPQISLNDTVSRIEFVIDSLQFIKDREKLTHDPMINPFSTKAASLPPPPEPAKKNIPKPRYAP